MNDMFAFAGGYHETKIALSSDSAIVLGLIFENAIIVSQLYKRMICIAFICLSGTMVSIIYKTFPMNYRAWGKEKLLLLTSPLLRAKVTSTSEYESNHACSNRYFHVKENTQLRVS